MSVPASTCLPLSPPAAPEHIKKELHARVSPENVETEKGGAHTRGGEHGREQNSWKINIKMEGGKKMCAAALCLLYITTTSK